MKKIIILFLSFFLFGCGNGDLNSIENGNINFFTQAPLETDKNWQIHENSCEEASILLYTSFLSGKKYDKNSFNKELIKMKEFQKNKYKKETDLKKYKLKDFINDYFKSLQAFVVGNLNNQKITWLLKENKPILIGINSNDIDNPYYHYANYHTLLIIGETEFDYIVKDVGTKKGNNWKYPKNEIIKAIKNTGNWGIVIQKIKNKSINTDAIKKEKGYNYSTFQSKSYYDNLVYDEHNGLSINIPNDIGFGIIAHHLVVGPYFDNYFRILKEKRPKIKTFILVGTNHFNFDNEIYTTSLNYKTPFGILEIDKNLQKKLNLKVNNKVLFNEHSINSVVGFIKKFYPESHIVPIIINENISKEKLEELKKNLVKNYDLKNYFYLQSTDFTHFQPQYATDFFDLYNKNALDDTDIDRVDKMMVDCRKIMYLTFSLLKEFSFEEHYNLINSSSNNFYNIENFLNTSHFFSYFGKGKNLEKKGQLSLLFTGDMILNYDIPENGKITETGKRENIAYPFDKIDSFEETFFRGYDEIITNIEGNIGEKTFEKDIKGGPIYFKFNKDWLKMIKNIMKAKVVFFSNNHLRDFGDEWISKTKIFVENAGLKFIGTGTGFFSDKNVYKRKIGKKELIVININDVVTPLFDYDLKLLEKYIKENKKQNTIVIIYIHWGKEYELKANKRQIKLAHKFIDYGADLVVGSHSHTIQNKEIYKQKRIYYSLGNLTYDSKRQKAYIPEVKFGLFLGVNFHNNKIDFFEIPYKIEDRKPVLLIGKQKKTILKIFKN